MTNTNRTVLLLGATGLVGRECLDLLVEDPAVGRVVTITRRPVPEVSTKLLSHVIDLDRMSDCPLPKVDQVICALGTTIKQAGSQEQFRHVDFDYPVAAAMLGLERGATHFLVVSALGADASSRIFYNRVKGELEKAVLRLPYRSVTIVRPSLLLGDRHEPRLGEEIAKRFGFLMPRKYSPVEARAVAAVLVHAADEDTIGHRIIESAEIPSIAGAVTGRSRNATAVLFLVTCLIFATACNEKDRVIEARLAYAAGLRDGAAVRYLGVQVGYVDKIAFADSAVHVVIRVQRDDVPLRANDFVALRVDGLFGETIIDIIPGPSTGAPVGRGTVLQSIPESIAVTREAFMEAFARELARRAARGVSSDSVDSTALQPTPRTPGRP